MIRFITKLTLPVVALSTGFLFFPKEWRKSSHLDRKLTSFNSNVLEELTKTKEFQKLANDESITKIIKSETFPLQFQSNHVGSGILFGPNLMEIDPVIFISEGTGELTSFYHLGSGLISQDGQIHNGIISTILDEGLCFCGFPKLPSKKGVTAKLSINFENQAPPNSTVVLRAKVIEAKGRKVVIDGSLETFPLDGSNPIKIANSKCILVEPKWFKYISWLQIF